MSKFVDAAREAAERERVEREEAERDRQSARREVALEHVKELLGISSLSELNLTAKQSGTEAFLWADGPHGVAAVELDEGWVVHAVELVEGGWTRLGEPVNSLADVGERMQEAGY